MATKKQRFVAFVLILCLQGTTMSAYAGLNDALEGMFGNVTAPQAFKNQSRAGMVGGGMAARFPVRNVNLVSFDPPRLSAGCGGIDLYGGSFSFINADQLVALFRQIAANAVGVAFKAAIDAINPALGKLMKDFQGMLQSLNENMRNTCKMANTIVKKATDLAAKKEDVDSEATSEETASGGFEDMAGGLASLFTDTNKANKDASASGNCQECGNPVWKALMDSNVASRLGNPMSGETDEYGTKEIIMSLAGTIINSPNSAYNSENPDGSEKPYIPTPWSASMTLRHLRDGSKVTGTPLKVLRCDTHDRDGCLIVNERDTQFNGVWGYVNNMLFGDPSGASVDESSIVGKLTVCTGGGATCELTSAQKQFLEVTTVPAFGLMRRVQKYPGAAATFATVMAPIITDELAVLYGQAALQTVKATFSGTKISKPDFVFDAEKELSAEMIQMRASAADQVKKIVMLKTMADAIASANPAILAGAASGK